ncbi:hypothetical protein AMS66_12635 [Paenibacillus xylanivorans]|uniref:Uncharacterized protein n=1 Tax=Paenibacillus xylanivorans TaxID=1705561 RepID=A0A0N0C4S3_9BACL|nr:hypothetical protein AMS66_12635 [Paenibacillus xylanivorans]
MISAELSQQLLGQIGEQKEHISVETAKALKRSGGNCAFTGGEQCVGECASYVASDHWNMCN